VTPADVLALLGIGSSVVTSLVDLVLGQLLRWVASSAGQVLAALGGVLTATTEPDLAHGVSGELGVMAVVGALLALFLLVLAMIQAVVRQDLGGVVRAVLLRLPVAILLAAAGVELVSLGLEASDAISSAVLAAAGHPVESLVASLGTALAGSALVGGAPGVAIGGFAALLLAALVIVLSFAVWFELVVRSAAVAVATLFLPLALAGLVLPATTHWARRLAETLVALVFAKVVIAGVIALASVTLTSGSGVSALVEGTALLLLCVLAPFTVLRLVPFVEAGAVSHLDGLGHRSLRGAIEYAGYGAALEGMAGAAASALGMGGGTDAPSGDGWPFPDPDPGPAGGGRGPGGGSRVVDDVGPIVVAWDDPEVLAEADRIERELRRSSEEP